ncbi:MAG: AAA family ATPase, partial [Bacteroidota bacterium]
LQEAIDLLIDHTKGSNIQDSILLISGRYHNFRREDMNGLIRPDEASIRFNQITQALLVTLDELEDKPLLSDTQSSSNRALENIKQGTRSIQETQLKRRKSVVSQKDRQEIVQLNDGPSSREEKILFSELQSAKELEGTSNWQSALAIYQKLIAQNVNLLGAWKGLVRIYQRLEDIENLAVAVDNVKLLENILAFEENTRKVISLKELKVDHLAFYRQFNWKFQPQMNVLLGRNGYGKSFLLRLVIALLQNEYEITSDYFRNTHRSPSVELKVDRSGESRSIVRDRMLFTEQFGKVPVLAISDLRFLNRSSTSIQRADSKGSDLRENGAYHFLYNQPYSDLIQTFLYELCLEYIDKNHSFNLAIFRLVHSVVQELTDNEFRFHRIERLDNAQFLIEVITEGNSEPLPIQFASQGTLSILAIFGLIYNYLRSLNPNASKQDIPKCSGIVFIDEVDAHLHPTWQQKIVALLKETFPNVQFIITAHNPLVVAGCKENEAAVFRKTSNGFHIHQFERHFIGADMSDMYQTIFETEEKDATYLKYAAMRPFKKQLKGELRQIIEKYLPDEETQKQFHQLNEKIETYLSKLETPPEDNDSILQDALTTNELDQWVDIQKQRQPSKADKEKIDELNEILYYIAEFEEVEAKRKEQRNIRRQQSERKALKAKIDQSKDSADTP